jgi:hypothetical protein
VSGGAPGERRIELAAGLAVVADGLLEVPAGDLVELDDSVGVIFKPERESLVEYVGGLNDGLTQAMARDRVGARGSIGRPASQGRLAAGR